MMEFLFFDWVIQGDLLWFYMFKGFKKVNKLDYSYKLIKIFKLLKEI